MNIINTAISAAGAARRKKERKKGEGREKKRTIDHWIISASECHSWVTSIRWWAWEISQVKGVTTQNNECTWIVVKFYIKVSLILLLAAAAASTGNLEMLRTVSWDELRKYWVTYTVLPKFTHHPMWVCSIFAFSSFFFSLSLSLLHPIVFLLLLLLHCKCEWESSRIRIRIEFYLARQDIIRVTYVTCCFACSSLQLHLTKMIINIFFSSLTRTIWTSLVPPGNFKRGENYLFTHSLTPSVWDLTIDSLVCMWSNSST